MLLPLLLLFTSQSSPAVAAAEDIVPREYLTIAPVDRYGRRPFQPNAVFRDHLWKSNSAPPRVGQSVTGELGKLETWEARKAGDKGNLGGSLGFAYTAIDVPERQMVLAQLSGAWTLFVNGRPSFGDAYRFGFGGTPVVLEAGRNHIFVTGIRGGFSLRFKPVEPGLLHGGWDDTTPHLVLGEKPQGAIGIELTNASEQASGPLLIEWAGEGFTPGRLVDPGLQALGANHFSLPLDGPAIESLEPRSLAIQVSSADGKSPNIALSFSIALDVREPTAKRKRTYISSVDGGTVEYAEVPPSPAKSGESPERMGLVLSLHGAAVSSWGQAGAYQPKPDFWIVAPMNRRPFGFDWQDWGRRDAYDVLELAMDSSGVDPRYKYVSGHSMGGHGTWHLAANDLDGFAACAPSAGWVSFDSYGGRPQGELADLWQRADASSKTLDLIENLKQLPIYIVHGTADDNVPPTEAFSMMDALTKAAGSFDAHFEGGAGHWWGGRCVDWPGIFDLFRSHSIPVDPAKIDFTTVDPSIDAEHHWIRVEQPQHYGDRLRVHGGWNAEENRVSLTTKNVALFSVTRAIAKAVIDDQEFALDSSAPVHWFRWEAGNWSHVDSGPTDGEKHSRRSGPLKKAFDRNFIMVVGTGGDPAERDALMAAAQLQAGSWCYRANGRALVMTDQQYLARELSQGEVAGEQPNIILYGNRENNRAWTKALAPGCPLDVTAGRIELPGPSGPTTFKGDDLGCAFVYPGSASGQLIAVFASTGLDGARLSSNLQPFKSGAGYPDFTLFSGEILSTGDKGVLKAGWFNARWQFEE
ncbi:MAG: prolyl oligopeptidase family serine peptidase [bacterium]|nr:prolyl oligopeptidase family serine peptidase [bacterium]